MIYKKCDITASEKTRTVLEFLQRLKPLSCPATYKLQFHVMPTTVYAKLIQVAKVKVPARTPMHLMTLKVILYKLPQHVMKYLKDDLSLQLNNAIC